MNFISERNRRNVILITGLYVANAAEYFNGLANIYYFYKGAQ
jgi:hypothetical protein